MTSGRVIESVSSLSRFSRVEIKVQDNAIPMTSPTTTQYACAPTENPIPVRPSNNHPLSPVALVLKATTQ